jgi:hypothetical protein
MEAFVTLESFAPYAEELAKISDEGGVREGSGLPDRSESDFSFAAPTTERPSFELTLRPKLTQRPSFGRCGGVSQGASLNASLASLSIADDAGQERILNLAHGTEERLVSIECQLRSLSAKLDRIEAILLGNQAGSMPST